MTAKENPFADARQKIVEKKEKKPAKVTKPKPVYSESKELEFIDSWLLNQFATGKDVDVRLTRKRIYNFIRTRYKRDLKKALDAWRKENGYED